MAILKFLFSKPLKQNGYEKQLEEKVKKIKFEKESDYPFVSIIFPNWNGKKDTLECLDSLRKLNYPKSRMEIIITDNGSTDSSQAAITEKYGEMEDERWHNLKLIEIGENIGAPAAYNRGIQQANRNYDYIWKLDNDVVVDPNALVKLVKVGEINERIGGIGPYIKNYYLPNVSIKQGMNISLWTGNRAILSKGHDYASGCSLLIRESVISKIGLLDETYFVYWDDTDFCLRMLRDDYGIQLVRKSIVYHKVSQTTNNISSVFPLYYMTRNRFIIIGKFSNSLQKIFFIFWYVLIITPQTITFLLLRILYKKRKLRLIYTFFKASFDGFRILLYRSK